MLGQDSHVGGLRAHFAGPMLTASTLRFPIGSLSNCSTQSMSWIRLYAPVKASRARSDSRKISGPMRNSISPRKHRSWNNPLSPACPCIACNMRVAYQELQPSWKITKLPSPLSLFGCCYSSRTRLKRQEMKTDKYSASLNARGVS